MSKLQHGALADLAGAFDWTGTCARTGYALTLAAFLGLSLWIQALPALAPAGLYLLPLLGLVTLCFIGQTRRRLRALDWPGGLTWLVMVPVLGLILSLVLCLRPSATRPRRGELEAGRRLGFAVAVLVMIFVASRALWHPFSVLSGSMKPNLLVGDYVIVLRSFAAPDPGSVVTLRHPVNRSDFIKRVMAGPGDRIAMQDGRVVLNGVPVPQEAQGLFTEPMERQGPMAALPSCANAPVGLGGTCEKRLLRETRPDGRSYGVLDIRATGVDDTPTVEVPEGHVFVMGDNRDNSMDSRTAQAALGLGLVPLADVTGRAWRIAFSIKAPLERLWMKVP